MTLIYTRPAAMILFWMTFLAWVAVDLRIAMAGLHGTAASERPTAPPRSVRSIRGGLAAIWLSIACGFAATAADAFLLPWQWALLGIGLAVAWSGLVLRVWAKRKLGRFFVAAVAIQEGHRVITDGPYAIIRHPGYSGMLLSLLGLGLATANVLTLALFVGTPLYLLVRRIGTEEAALVSALGESYIAYQGKTTRLIPGVW